MITLNGTQIPILTFGQVKAAKDTLKRLEDKALDIYDRTEAAVAVLQVAVPELQVDSIPPVDLLKAATDLYLATFVRPESAAPGDQAGKSDGATSQA